MFPNVIKEVVYRCLEFVYSVNEFLTVEELRSSSRRYVQENRDIAELIEVGYSRSGDSVEALVVRGGDEKIVLAFGFPHPNEPVGSITLEFLTQILARDRDLLKKLGSTWVIVKIADVFGAKLNEGWFKGGFDLLKYALNYYRSPGYKQVEWSFPIHYKNLRFDNPVPETKALMKLIDMWKPTHIYSLHNAGFSGTYYYLTRDLGKEVLEILYSIPKTLGIPIHRGEPEAPYVRKLYEGVFLMPSTEDIYNWYEKYLEKPPIDIIKHGGSSYDYAKKVNPKVFELVSEVPYIYDDRLDNDTSVGIPRREILRLATRKEEEIITEIESYVEKLKPYISSDNPFYESITYFVEVNKKSLETEKKWVEEDPKLDENATVAQIFNVYTVTLFDTALRYGLLYRAINFEISSGIKTPSLESLREEIYKRIVNYVELFKKYSKYYIVPIEKLVKIQLASIITTVIGVDQYT
jgi:hypothetical protein